MALGEAHNNREIPAFTTALFRLLHEHEGFEFLILEQDPVMMERVSRPPAKGALQAIQSLARQYLKPFAPIAAAGQWTLVDLRPFREYPRRRALVAAGALQGEAAEELAALVYGFDALLPPGGAARDLRGHRRAVLSGTCPRPPRCVLVVQTADGGSLPFPTMSRFQDEHQ